jgi:hypothetical protein
MTDQTAPFQPGRKQTKIPFRPRSEFAGYKAFGSGDGAVLMSLRTERRLRSAAEFATQERRAAGGLLFGRGWTDDQGSYLVIDGFLEAGPWENSGGRVAAGGAGQFTLSGADLRLLRDDAARMYSASLEVGTLVTATNALHEPPPEQDPTAEPGPELVDVAAGEHLTEEPIPVSDTVTAVRSTGLTDAAAKRPLRQQAKRRWSGRARRRAPAPAGRRAPSRARVSPRGQARVPAKGFWGAPGPEVPKEVRLVAGALAIAAVLAAIIVGLLLHSLIATVIIGAIVLLVIF